MNVIEVRDVRKEFYRFQRPIMGSVRRLIGAPLREGSYQVFRALDGVSFNVRRGEVVGIIGANGSGKTTLLKMIAGLLPVDHGSIQVQGRIQALLALGAGVSPEFTGRENIEYSGMLLGLSKKEIRSKIPEIVEFAELGDFVDQPFRTYSSGMRARLLFSVSMAVTPEILIADEALATGDARFVQKCYSRLNEMLESGVTVLFVSHSISQIKQFCTRCVVLEKGRMIFDGPTEEAIEKYAESENTKSAQRHADRVRDSRNQGTGAIDVVDIGLWARGARTTQLVIGEPFSLKVEFEAKETLQGVTACAEIRSRKSTVAYSFVPGPPPFGPAAPFPIVFDLAAGRGSLAVEFGPLASGDGDYSIDLEMYPTTPGYLFSYSTCHCYYRELLHFSAVYKDSQMLNRGVLSEMQVTEFRVNGRIP